MRNKCCNKQKVNSEKIGLFQNFWNSKFDNFKQNSLNSIIKYEPFWVTVCKRSVRLFWDYQNWLNKIACCNRSNDQVVRTLDFWSQVHSFKTIRWLQGQLSLLSFELDQTNNRNSWGISRKNQISGSVALRPVTL